MPILQKVLVRLNAASRCDLLYRICRDGMHLIPWRTDNSCLPGGLESLHAIVPDCGGSCVRADDSDEPPCDCDVSSAPCAKSDTFSTENEEPEHAVSNHTPIVTSGPTLKKKILIVMHYMEIGGAETALIGLLHALSPKRVEVDLFLHDHRGEMMAFIPDWANLLPTIPAYTMLERPIAEVARRGFLRLALARLLGRHRAHRAYRRSGSTLADAGAFHYAAASTTPLLPMIRPDTEYDCAISFLTPHQVVRDKVRAKRKVAWIHTDYTRARVDAALELPVWAAFDAIVSISPAVTESFLKVFPTLEPKIIEIENILSPTFVRQRADEFDARPEMTGSGVSLLSIGRFCEAKNYDNVPDICRRLLQTGAEVTWYLIGYGGDEPLIRRKIAEAGVQDHVIILGKKTNPYPYIKACDIYVQPSRYEGKSVTVREAQMLGKPVVVTRYPTATSQVQDGVDGVIVPMDNAGCAAGLGAVIADSALQQRLRDYTAAHDYGNEHEVEKIYELMETAD